MAESRNDLEPFAMQLRPEIGEVLEFLAATTGVLASRMSGSGATCFGLFDSEKAANESADAAIAKGWWALSAEIAK